MRYILNMSPVLNKEQCSVTGRNITVTCGAKEIQLRSVFVPREIDTVCLVHDGEYLEMKREKTSEGFDYYTAQIVMGRLYDITLRTIHLLPVIIMIQMV